MKRVATDIGEIQMKLETSSSSGIPNSPADAWEAALELCQLRWLDDALTPLTALEEGIRYLRAKAAGLRRRAFALLSRAIGTGPEPYGGRARWSEREDGTFEARAPEKLTGGLKAGDLVEVLSIEDVRATLDRNWKHDGLKFLKPMEQYCGRKFRVLKSVHRILDEHNHAMQKTRDTVILAGGICHGQGLYGREGCDRSCFFFWKEAWLRNVEE
ncbi:MAG: hypothetical protein ABIE42_02370 [Candidatus Eisenbacteria bacterium]